MLDITKLSITERVALFISVLSGMGIIYHTMYYWHFGINITRYISASEVLLLFTNKFLVTSFFMLYIVPMTFIWGRIRNTTNIKNMKMLSKFARIRRSQHLYDRFNIFKPILRVLFVFIILVLIIMLIFIYFLKTDENVFKIIVVLIFALGINALFQIISFCLVAFARFRNKNYYLYTQFVFVAFLVLFISSDIDHQIVLASSSSDFKIERSEGSSLASGDSLLYVGKTESYTFLYNKKANKALVISNSVIKSYEFDAMGVP